MEIVILTLSVCAIIYALIIFSKTILGEYKMHKITEAKEPAMTNVGYMAMCERLTPIEDDVRPNNGKPLPVEKYYERADKMNSDTRIFEFINSEKKYYEW